jgi:hypothetical protein
MSTNEFRSASPNSLSIADALSQLKRGKQQDTNEEPMYFASVAAAVEGGEDALVSG